MLAMACILLTAATAQTQHVQLPPLDRLGSKQILRKAEKQLVEYRLSRSGGSPPSPGDTTRNSQRTNLVEHRGNPLAGRICEFNCRLKMTVMNADLIRTKGDSSKLVPTSLPNSPHDQTRDQYVIIAELKTGLANEYKFEDMYPSLSKRLDADIENRKFDLKQAKKGRRRSTSSEEDRLAHAKREKATKLRLFREGLQDLRHELRLICPVGYRPPPKMPPNFDAVFAVESVRIGAVNFLPTFTIYGHLLRSKKLGIDVPPKTQSPPRPDATPPAGP